LTPALGPFPDIRIWPVKVLVEGDHAIADFRWPLATVLVVVAVAIVGVLVITVTTFLSVTPSRCH
jgi:hypothetical protein